MVVRQHLRPTVKTHSRGARMFAHAPSQIRVLIEPEDLIRHSPGIAGLRNQAAAKTFRDRRYFTFPLDCTNKRAPRGKYSIQFAGHNEARQSLLQRDQEHVRRCEGVCQIRFWLEWKEPHVREPKFSRTVLQLWPFDTAAYENKLDVFVVPEQRGSFNDIVEALRKPDVARMEHNKFLGQS